MIHYLLSNMKRPTIKGYARITAARLRLSIMAVGDSDADVEDRRRGKRLEFLQLHSVEAARDAYIALMLKRTLGADGGPIDDDYDIGDEDDDDEVKRLRMVKKVKTHICFADLPPNIECPFDQWIWLESVGLYS